MMNTIEYINERNRMCKSYDDGCVGCPAFNACDDDLFCVVGNQSTLDAKEQVAMVEKWAKENPRKTRQAAFDKLSEDNKQESNPVPQQTEKQANPFGNLKPAEIPTRLHTFSYQGCEKRKRCRKQKEDK